MRRPDAASFLRDRRATVTAAAAVLIVLAGLGLAALRATAADPAPAAARPALTVTTALPQRGALPLTLVANGSIAAWQEASIGAQVGGLRLADVRVNVGDTVKAGQVLATFAPETVQASLAQARASLLEAEASAADARANNERARTLANSGALSASQIAQYATSAQTADARVAAARAQVQAQQLQVGFTEVRAPDSGVISSRTATVGAVVGAGTELFRMVRKGRLEWRAEVTSAELGRIRPGARVQVTAASGAILDGAVRTIGPTVDSQTRNALVYVDLPAQSRNGLPAKAGMFASGAFALGESEALTVPQSAVVVREAFSYVFVPAPAEGQQRVAQRKVQTGRRVGDRVEITGGLAADQPVVVTGAGFLNDRDIVRVAQSPVK
ncbi:efflux RND transporter periplasmic adaptor subunit [Xylophilus sp.]|uniref:efflux RND transporter periplasmic adaptor subunit n=1 Tax=Xylophilus sp. TaxID=2653893 RepID=UPI002D8069EA|nr:efflux RND transporter periplasmic adaptor subunit [Xylophilus sp.]